MTGFTPEDLLDCYRMGVFPMGEARDDPRVMIVQPQLRGVLPLDGFHVSRRLARQVRQDVFDVRVNQDFRGTVAACAAPSDTRDETWINKPIEKLYGQLHDMGQAHSVECYQDDVLVGGLYGVSIGAAFFGESMFSRETGASKVALVHLVARLRLGGFALLDCQFQTPHLARFGVTEIPQTVYLARLSAALKNDGDFFAAGEKLDGYSALQATSQAS